MFVFFLDKGPFIHILNHEWYAIDRINVEFLTWTHPFKVFQVGKWGTQNPYLVADCLSRDLGLHLYGLFLHTACNVWFIVKVALDQKFHCFQFTCPAYNYETKFKNLEIY